jgi:hypothetical protein
MIRVATLDVGYKPSCRMVYRGSSTDSESCVGVGVRGVGVRGVGCQRRVISRSDVHFNQNLVSASESSASSCQRRVVSCYDVSLDFNQNLVSASESSASSCQRRVVSSSDVSLHFNQNLVSASESSASSCQRRVVSCSDVSLHFNQNLVSASESSASCHIAFRCFTSPQSESCIGARELGVVSYRVQMFHFTSIRILYRRQKARRRVVSDASYQVLRLLFARYGTVSRAVLYGIPKFIFA